MSKFLKIAYKMADRSGADKYKLAALVVRGGAIVSSSTNLGRYGRCAERRALRPHLDLEGCTLYVVRAKGYVSKPCGKCMRAIAASGIKWVVYINELRQVEEVKLGTVAMVPLAPVFQAERYPEIERW